MPSKPFGNIITPKLLLELISRLRSNNQINSDHLVEKGIIPPEQMEELYNFSNNNELFSLGSGSTSYDYTLRLGESVEGKAINILLEIIASENAEFDESSTYNGATFLEHLTCVLLREYSDRMGWEKLLLFPSAIKNSGTSHDGGVDFHGTLRYNPDRGKIAGKNQTKLVIGQTKVGGITSEHRRSMIYCWQMCADSSWRKKYTSMIPEKLPIHLNQVICVFSHLSSVSDNKSYEKQKLLIYELGFEWFSKELATFAKEIDGIDDNDDFIDFKRLLISRIEEKLKPVLTLIQRKKESDD